MSTPLQHDEMHIILDACSDAIQIRDLDGNYLYINDAGCVAIGKKREEILARNLDGHEPPATSRRGDDDDRPTPPAMEAFYGVEEIAGEHGLKSYSVTRGPSVGPNGAVIGEFQVAREVATQVTDERRADNILQHAPIGILLVDEAGKIVMANQRTQELFRYGQGEFVGLSLEALVPQDVGHRHASWRAAFLRDPHARRMGRAGVEVTGLRKDGSEFACDVALSPVVCEGVALVVASISDASERREVRQNLLSATTRLKHELAARTAREAHLRAVGDAALDAIVACDEAGSVTFWNQGAEDMFGYAAAEVLGGPMDRIVPARLHASHRQGLAHAVRGESKLAYKGFSMSTRGLRKDGTEFPVELSLGSWVAGNKRFFTGVLRDDSQRRTDENNLRRFAQMVTNSNDAFVGSDLQGNINLWNRAAERIFGFAQHEVLARPLSLLIPPECHREAQEIGKILSGATSGLEFETERMHKDGHRIPVAIRLSQQTDRALQVTGTYGIIRDISSQKMQLDALDRARRAKDEFLAAVSHELRTPLNAILGVTEALEANVYGESNVALRGPLRSIRESGEHLLGLINDVLSVAQLGAGKVKVQTERVPVDALLDEVCNIALPLAVPLDLTLEVVNMTKLETICVDRIRIKQILLNLLSNAIKHSPRGGTVSLHCSQRSVDPVIFSVGDSGPGISRAQQEILFEPFAQLEQGPSAKHAGVGLGLAVSMELAKLHGGTIQIQSVVGEGSCFSLLLPHWVAASEESVAAASESSLTVEVPRQRDSTSGASVAAKKSETPSDDGEVSVLIVDDNQSNIAHVADYLRHYGLRVESAKGGEEGCKMARDLMPSVVVMDVQMPGMDGIEAIQCIRRDRMTSKIPIVATTALAMASDKERCLKAGADDYLSKPFTLKALRALVKKLATQQSG